MHKPNLKNNTKDYFMNMIKSQKKNYLNNNKKTITTSSITNHPLKQYKILKSNKAHNKSKNKINLNSENDKNKKRKEISNNFDRNNKFIENTYFDDEISTNNLLNVNRSNYIIKVKTKINHIDSDNINEKNTLNKNGENVDGIEEKNSDENDDNKNDINGNSSTNNQLNSINVTSEKRKHNKTFGKTILADISTKNIRRYQYSNSITKKHIKRFKEIQKEKKDCLEKVKFIQLWWKTIFQIIKIQKHLRGFLYRQKLIEELDKEEIAVDRLLFLIKSYKKIVFNIFIHRLRKYKAKIRYYFIKWYEKTKKKIIINRLLEIYNDNDNNYDENNTSSEVIKYEFDSEKNNIFRDSTNSLINNIEIIDAKYNNNTKNINSTNNNNINSKQNNNDNNNENDNDNEYEKNGKLSIENYHIKNYIASVNTRKTEQLNDKTKKILNEINEKNKLLKKKKLKKKGSKNYGNRTVNKSSHKNNTMTNTLLLSSNNKISNKKRIKNNNMINTETNKSETKNNFTGKKLKKSKMTNKCISKEIIPFSMSNNNNNNENNNKVKSDEKSDLNNLNSMINSANNNISSSKNFKIYENHIRDYRKPNNKNKNKEKDEKNNKDLSDNISQIHNDNMKLLNDKNINSSIESSFLGSIKSSIKKIDLNKVSKYFYFWYNKGFYIKIRNKLRSLSKLFKFFEKIKKNKICNFFKKFKKYQNFVIILQLKKFFSDTKVKIVKKIIIKCYAHIIIKKYHEIVYKKKILRKLKEYLIKAHTKIINEIQNDIKSIKNDNKEYKENKEKGHSISKKNIKFNNKNELIIQLPKNNLVLSATTNKSMLNLFNPEIPLDLNQKERIGYNFTEGKHSNKNVNYNIITKTLKLDLNKKKDTITQNNQLTMVINLVEHLRIKNIKKDPSLLGCFRKWKNNIVINFTKKKFSGRINEPTVFTDIEDLPKNRNMDDHYQSEPEICTKSEHVSLSVSQNSNIQNKYVPVRGVKYFQGKVKPNNNPDNKNKKYKVNNLIDNYKTSTIPTNNTFNTNTYNSNERIEVVHNNMNMNLNDNFRTFNDSKTLECNNNIIINNSNNYLKIKNLIQKAKILLPSKNQNSNCIYHRKALGVSLKNNINNNYNIYNNNTNSNTKNKNYQYTNDSINTTLDNNYGANFLTLINNASFLENYKIEPLMLFKNDNEHNKVNVNSNVNCNLIFNKNGKVNESINSKNLYGFKKMNKIEEKEICFFPNKNNNINIINNINNNKSNTINDKNSHYNNRYDDDEDISIVSEMKKYYNENRFIKNNNENKKKFNSFIINIFNNTIIMIQKTKHKRSNSK